MLKKIVIGFFILLFLFVGFAYIFPVKGHIPILMYHFVVPKDQVGDTSLSVSVEHFEKQMWFLRKFGFKPISIDEFFEIKSGKKEPQGREVLITFDDGNETYIQYALPILERYQIPSFNGLVWNSLQYRQHGSMSLEVAKKYSKHPLITFGSHTLTHPVLTEISLDQAETEIIESKINLEKALERPIKYFTYPTGMFNEDIIQMVKKAGYKIAFTTGRKRLKGRRESLFTTTRFKVHPKYNLFVFWAHLAGIVDFGKQIDLYFHQLTVNKSSVKLSAYNPASKTT